MFILILGKFKKATPLKRHIVGSVRCDDDILDHADLLWGKYTTEDMMSQPKLINKADFPRFCKGNHMAPSKQLRDMVLDIVKKNKDIGFDDIIIQMKKQVGIRGDSLIKLVGEILKWWEEGGKILQMVDRRTKMGMYRMNENTKITKNIIDEALGELGISKTSEESLTEAINPRTIDPKGWYGIYTHERLKQKLIVGPYPSEKEAYHDYGGDWDNIFMGTELIKRLNKGEYKDFTLKAMTESDNITEARGYRKVKDLDGTKSLWELRTLYGMSYLIVSYSPYADETAVFKSDRNGKPLSYSEVYSTRGRLEPEPIIRDIANGKIKPMDESLDEAAKIIPPANLLREFEKLIKNYRDSGLKGADNFDKKTILDDEKELRKVFDLLKKGEIDKAWDAYENLDSALQLDVVPDRIVQFMDKNLSEGALDVEDVMEDTLVENRRLERFIQTFYKIHPKINLHGMSKDELEKIADKAMKQGDGGSKSLVLLKTFLKKAGATEMFGESIDESVVAKKSEKFKAGIPKWFHTVFTGMSKYPSQLIAGWKTELKTGSGMPGYMTYVLHYDGVGTYTVYHNKGRGLKVEINGDKPLGNFRSPEEAMDFVEKNVLSEKIK